MTLLSYKNDPNLKQMMLDEMKLHVKQDQLIQGAYSRIDGVFKGCAVGCGVDSLNRKLGLTLSYKDHARYSKTIGIPEWLARLEDTIFEGLPEKESQKFPVEFLEAIPVGKDLTLVEFKFKKFLLQENYKIVSNFKDILDELKAQILKAIDLCLGVMDEAIKTGKLNESARSAARSAAMSTAWSAAMSATESAAWSAAESAAWSARSAAESAARSATESAVWSAAMSATESAAFLKYKNELLKLLKETEVVKPCVQDKTADKS